MLSGYHYELFCVTKSSLTPHCVVSDIMQHDIFNCHIADNINPIYYLFHDNAVEFKYRFTSANIICAS